MGTKKVIRRILAFVAVLLLGVVGVTLVSHDVAHAAPTCAVAPKPVVSNNSPLIITGVTVSQACVQPGDAASVSVSGYVPSSKMPSQGFLDGSFNYDNGSNIAPVKVSNTTDRVIWTVPVPLNAGPHTVYFLASYGLGSNSITFTIPEATPVTKPTVNLTASSTSLTVGQSTILSWNSTNAVSLTASGDWSGFKKVPSSSQTVTPGAAGTYTYKLTATGAGGTTSAKPVIVTVKDKTPPPPICTSNPTYSLAKSVDSAGVHLTLTTDKPVCADTTLTGGIYLPDGASWDGGWDASIGTLHLYSSQSFTVLKGQSSATALLKAPAASCGYKYDVVPGTSLPSTFTYEHPLPGWVVGGLVTGNACGGVTPPPAVVDVNVTLTGICGVNNDKPVPSTSADYTSVVSPWKDSKVSVTFTMKPGVNKVFANGEKSITITKDEVDTSVCFPTSPPSIMAKGSCDCKVKFSNPNGFPVEVWAGNKSMSHIDEHFVVSAHSSKVVTTTRTTLYYQIAWKGGNAAETVYSVNVPQNCGTPTPTPTSSTTQPTSPSSSPSPSSPSSTSTATPTSTSSGTPTSTAPGTPSSTSSSSSKPGHSNSSTATSTSKSSSSSATKSSSSKTTGPPIVTDGPQSPSGGRNAGVLWGGIAVLIGIGAAGIGLRRRLSN